MYICLALPYTSRHTYWNNDNHLDDDLLMIAVFSQVLGFLFWTVTTHPTNLLETTLPLFLEIPLIPPK